MRSAYGLADAEEVAFAVAEPRAPLADALRWIVALDVGDRADGAHPRCVHLLELDASAPQLGDRRVDVGDVERHLRVVARRLAARLEERERCLAQSIQQA